MLKSCLNALWMLIKTVGLVALGGWLGYQAGLFFGLAFPWLLIPILIGMAITGYMALQIL